MGRHWDEDNVALLIEIIKKCESMWNTRHPRYTTNKKVRQQAWIDITNLYNDYSNKKYTPRDLLSKWNLLKWQFKNQKTKTALGLESNWRHYEKLSFLSTCRTKKRKKKSSKKIIKDETDFVSKKNLYTERDTAMEMGPVSEDFVPEEDSMSEREPMSERNPISERDPKSERDPISGKNPVSEKDLSKTRMLSPQMVPYNDESHTLDTTSGGCYNMGVKPEPVDEELVPILVISEKGRSNCEMQKAFGNYIAEELMHLNVDLQFRAKKIIFNVLMDLQQEQEQRRKRGQA